MSADHPLTPGLFDGGDEHALLTGYLAGCAPQPFTDARVELVTDSEGNYRQAFYVTVGQKAFHVTVAYLGP